MVWSLEFRGSGLGFQTGTGFRVEGLGFRVWGLRSRQLVKQGSHEHDFVCLSFLPNRDQEVDFGL